MVEVTTRGVRGAVRRRGALEHWLARLVSPTAIRRTAVTLAVVALVFAMVGTLKYYVVEGRLGRLDLDREYGAAAAVSAVVIGVAALASVGCAYVSRGAARVWFCALTSLFGLMALDEAFVLHERLARALDVRWQVLYSPIMLLAAVAVVMLIRDTWPDQVPVKLLVAGAVAWACAQLLDVLEFTGDAEHRTKVDGYGVMMIVEETLELAGSSMFLLALMIVLQRRLDQPATA